MGLYDYDPEKQSPGDFTACELAFHAGDVLQVYGEERQDGFYHGERQGQRGLVPACFVQPVSQPATPAQVCCWSHIWPSCCSGYRGRKGETFNRRHSHIGMFLVTHLAMMM